MDKASSKTQSNGGSSSSSSGSNERDFSTYFRVANPIWFVVIGSLMTYLTMMAYSPSSIPFSKLGQFGEFSKHLALKQPVLTKYMCWAAWGAHVLEACYAVYVGKNALNMKSCVLTKWFVQTALLGYPSTSLIVAAKAKKLKRN